MLVCKTLDFRSMYWDISIDYINENPYSLRHETGISTTFTFHEKQNEVAESSKNINKRLNCIYYIRKIQNNNIC